MFDVVGSIRRPCRLKPAVSVRSTVSAGLLGAAGLEVSAGVLGDSMFLSTGTLASLARSGTSIFLGVSNGIGSPTGMGS